MSNHTVVALTQAHLLINVKSISTGHYNDVIMGAVASQITSLTIVYSIVYSDADQRKHQSSASLAFVRRIHRGPVNSLHKWPVTRKMFSFDDVIMKCLELCSFWDAISERNPLPTIFSIMWFISSSWTKDVPQGYIIPEWKLIDI